MPTFFLGSQALEFEDHGGLQFYVDRDQPREGTAALVLRTASAKGVSAELDAIRLGEQIARHHQASLIWVRDLKGARFPACRFADGSASLLEAIGISARRNDAYRHSVVKTFSSAWPEEEPPIPPGTRFQWRINARGEVIGFEMQKPTPNGLAIEKELREMVLLPVLPRGFKFATVRFGTGEEAGHVLQVFKVELQFEEEPMAPAAPEKAVAPIDVAPLIDETGSRPRAFFAIGFHHAPNELERAQLEAAFEVSLGSFQDDTHARAAAPKEKLQALATFPLVASLAPVSIKEKLNAKADELVVALRTPQAKFEIALDWHPGLVEMERQAVLAQVLGASPPDTVRLRVSAEGLTGLLRAPEVGLLTVLRITPSEPVLGPDALVIDALVAVREGVVWFALDDTEAPPREVPLHRSWKVVRYPEQGLFTLVGTDEAPQMERLTGTAWVNCGAQLEPELVQWLEGKSIPAKLVLISGAEQRAEEPGQHSA